MAVEHRPEPVLDFPLAWLIVTNANFVHAEACSFAQTSGALLCDCSAITEYFTEHYAEYVQVAKMAVVRHIHADDCPVLKHDMRSGAITYQNREDLT